MEEGAVLFFISLILRIIGVIVCANKARELNRSGFGWGLFGWFMPIVAMIIVSTLKPKVNWHNESGSVPPSIIPTNPNEYAGGYDGGHNASGMNFSTNQTSSYTNEGYRETESLGGNGEYKEGELYK